MSQRRICTVQNLILKVAAVVFPVLLASSPAAAANRQAQDRAARKACLTGDYTKGVAILSDLFIDTKDPTYIFNQGRCFEQNRKYEDAIGRFEEFVRAAEASGSKQDPADKAAAEKHIASCKETLAEQQGKMASPAAPQTYAPPAPIATAMAAPALAPQAPALTVEQTVPQPAPEQGRKGLLAAGIVTASVGGAAVIAGVLLNLKVNSMVDDMQNTVGNYSSGKDSDRKTYQTLAWIGYGVGAACIATGATLIGFGLKADGGGTTSVALLPTVGGGQAGVLLTGGF